MGQTASKYWNVGWSQENAPATKRQRWAIQHLSGGKYKYREIDMSMADADLLIQKLNAEKKKSVIPNDGQMEDAFFRAVINKAVDAANKAGEAYMKAHPEPSYYIHHGDDDYEPVYGALGDAYIRWPRKRTKLDHWLSQNLNNGQKKYIPLPHNFVGRREVDLLEVCEKAALEVFERNNILGLKLFVHRP